MNIKKKDKAMADRSHITVDRLHELFHYNPETGVLTWKVDRIGGTKAGQRAGCKNTIGYRTVNVDGRRMYEHRVIWQMVTGLPPSRQIDHRNGVRDDNRLANLREATNAENNRNTGVKSHNTSGHVGVSWAKREGKWRAYITVNGRQIGLGYFNEIEAAIAARLAAQKKYFCEFSFEHANDNKPLPAAGRVSK